ncbi:MAG: YdcF family protein [Atopobiaceae bacterium]|nr:YdcF family protein [Atopobiaceae bacterium]
MQEHVTEAKAREKRLGPAVAIFQIGCMLAGTWMFAGAHGNGHGSLWLCALVAWLLPNASNMCYWITHHKTNVGMLFPAIASIAPASLAALLWADLDGVLEGLLWVAFVISCGTIALCVFWFGRLHSVYAHAPKAEHDAIIIVLGGTIRNGLPCPTLVQRLKKAEELWHDSPDRMLVLTGGPVPDDPDERTEADYMAGFLASHGVPRKSMLLERKALDTAQNICNSLALLEESQDGEAVAGRQLCVLTSNYHLYRAVTEGRKHGVDLVPIACPTPPISCLQQWSREILAILLS